MRIPDYLVPAFDSRDEYEVFVADCIELHANIIKELRDKSLEKRLHSSDGTYLSGCRGPLCKTAHRIVARQQSGGQQSRYFKIMEPIIRYMGEEIQATIDRATAAARAQALAENQILVGTIAPTSSLFKLKEVH